MASSSSHPRPGNGVPPASSSSHARPGDGSSHQRTGDGRGPTDPDNDDLPDPDLDEDYYQTLQLDPTATAEDIKTAFRSLSKQYHPDKISHNLTQKNGAEKQASFSRFLKIDKAYRILSNETLREFYDRHGMAAMASAERVPKSVYERRPKNGVHSKQRSTYNSRSFRTTSTIVRILLNT